MTLPFQFWKEALRVDAKALGKLEEFEFLGDIALRLFYERGCQPSVQSIIQDVEKIA